MAIGTAYRVGSCGTGLHASNWARWGVMLDADTKLGWNHSRFPGTRLTALEAASNRETVVRAVAL